MQSKMGKERDIKSAASYNFRPSTNSSNIHESQSFYERLQSDEQHRIQQKERNIKKNEDSKKSDYTFTPRLISREVNNTRKGSVYERLYK